jgi:hypothetical protein
MAVAATAGRGEPSAHRERQRLARAIEDELLSRPPARVIVAALDNADELGTTVAELVISLADRDYNTTVLDLTNRGMPQPGHRVVGGGRFADRATAPSVLRPRGLPALARGAGDLLPVDCGTTARPPCRPPWATSPLGTGVTGSCVGADHLTEWADRVVLVVSAGRSKVEKIRTVGEMIRGAGLDLRFTALLRTERTDDSSGMRPDRERGSGPATSRAGGPGRTGSENRGR